MYEINAAMRKIVDSNGLKHRKIAEKSGMKEAAVSAILRCTRRIYADELYPLCQAIGVSLDEVIPKNPAPHS